MKQKSLLGIKNENHLRSVPTLCKSPINSKRNQQSFHSHFKAWQKLKTTVAGPPSESNNDLVTTIYNSISLPTDNRQNVREVPLQYNSTQTASNRNNKSSRVGSIRKIHQAKIENKASVTQSPILSKYPYIKLEETPITFDQLPKLGCSMNLATISMANSIQLQEQQKQGLGPLTMAYSRQYSTLQLKGYSLSKDNSLLQPRKQDIRNNIDWKSVNKTQTFGKIKKNKIDDITYDNKLIQGKNNTLSNSVKVSQTLQMIKQEPKVSNLPQNLAEQGNLQQSEKIRQFKELIVQSRQRFSQYKINEKNRSKRNNKVNIIEPSSPPSSSAKRLKKLNILQEDIIRQKQNLTPVKCCFCQGIDIIKNGKHRAEDCKTPQSQGCSADKIIKKSLSLGSILQSRTNQQNQPNSVLRQSFYCKETSADRKNLPKNQQLYDTYLKRQYEQILKGENQWEQVKQKLFIQCHKKSLRDSFSPKMAVKQGKKEIYDMSPALLTKYQRLLPDIIYEEQSDDQEQDSLNIPQGGMRISRKYLAFLFQVLKYGPLDILDKETCRSQLLTEYLRCYLAPILGKIRYKNQKYTLHHFVEQMTKMVEALERGQIKKVKHQITLLAKKTDGFDNPVAHLSVSQYQSSISQYLDLQTNPKYPGQQTDRTQTIARTSISTNIGCHELQSSVVVQTFSIEQDTVNNKPYMGNNLVEEIENVLFNEHSSTVGNRHQLKRQQPTSPKFGSHDINAGCKENNSPMRQHRKDQFNAPSFFKRSNLQTLREIHGRRI